MTNRPRGWFAGGGARSGGQPVEVAPIACASAVATAGPPSGRSWILSIGLPTCDTPRSTVSSTARPTMSSASSSSVVSAGFLAYLRSPVGQQFLVDSDLRLTGSAHTTVTTPVGAPDATEVQPLPDGGPTVATALAQAIGATPTG